jgi:hypothetical protein
MKRFILYIILLFSCCVSMYSQENDTILFTNIKFEVNTDKILPNDFGYQYL